MNGEGDAVPMRVTGSGLAALRGTRPWALAVGGVWLAGLVAGGLWMVFFLANFPPQEMPHGAWTAVRAFMAGTWALEAVFVVAFATLALQYGRRLGTTLRGGDAAQLEAALYAQRRFWTLAGAVTIAMIAIWILAVIAAIAVPVIIGLHHAG